MSEAARAALAQYKLANLWQRRGEPQRALAGYARAIELDPACVPAHLERGDLLLRQMQREAALDAYRAGLQTNPNDPSLTTHLAHALAKEGLLTGEQTYLATARATANGAGGVLLITDCGGIYGVPQFNQLLLEGLQTAGYPIVEGQKTLAHWLENHREPHESSETMQATELLECVLDSVKPAFVIFSDGNPLSNLAIKELVQARGIPYFVIVHVTAVAGSASATALARLADVYRTAREVIAVSEANLRALRRDFGLPVTRGKAIYTACSAIYFEPRNPANRARIRQALGIPPEAVLAFTAARMELGKGYQYQLSALKQLYASAIGAPLYAVWAGSGTLESQLRAEVSEHGLQARVKFLGERADIPALLDASDLFILTSEQEGMPRAVVEAMAKGLPVAATAVDGVPEALGGTGQLLANPNLDSAATVQALVETLSQWLTAPQVRAASGRACHARALELFQPEPMQRAYLAIFENSHP